MKNLKKINSSKVDEKTNSVEQKQELVRSSHPTFDGKPSSLCRRCWFTLLSYRWPSGFPPLIARTSTTGMMYIQYLARKDRLSLVSPRSLASFSCSIRWMKAAVSGCGPVSMCCTRTLDRKLTALSRVSWSFLPEPEVGGPAI